MTKQAGCKLPWIAESLAGDQFKTCEKMEQFSAFSWIYTILAVSEQRDVLNITNCKLPCEYREIRPVGTPIVKKIGEDSGRLAFALTLVTTDMRVETQALVYPFTSHVSNFGGSLGLFLVLFFFMPWDWVLYLFLVVYKKANINKYIGSVSAMKFITKQAGAEQCHAHCKLS